MRGMILAGGVGSRLKPLTERINKHLLPVYNKPMIFYPIELMKSLGIEKILIITSRENAGLTEEICGDGSRFGVDITYKVQEYVDGKQTGMAKAVELGADFIDGGRFVVIAADNIVSFEDSEIIKIKNMLDQKNAMIFLKHIKNTKEFGIAELKDGKIISIEEKPEHPKSDYGISAMYLFDSQAFSIIKGMKPSKRGEYEITDICRAYMEKRMLDYHILEGEWVDAGTFEGLYEAQRVGRQICKGMKNKKE